MLDPLHQFEIHKLVDCSIGGIDLSFTNASLFMVIITVLVCFFLHFCTSEHHIIPSRKQSICEILFEFVAGMITEQVSKDALKYMPYIFSLFIFILGANLIGLFPYAFTVTSHIVVTFTLAMLVFLGITIVGIVKHRAGFLKMFFPPDVPVFIAPLLIPVEIISYMARPISLSVRLFANMVAGHIVLKLVAGAAIFCAVHSMAPVIVFPVCINMIMMVFELFVAILQAYVFTILSCIYLNSVVHLH